MRVVGPIVGGTQPPREIDGGAGGVPPLRGSLSLAARARADRAGARDRALGNARGTGALMSFDAPFVLALAPLVAGAAWLGTAWGRPGGGPGGAPRGGAAPPRGARARRARAAGAPP